MSRLRLIGTVCATLLYASTASAVLVNQYTFNNGTANDSGPGAQHGTVVDPSGVSRYVGGLLDLTANNGVLSNSPDAGAYVNLPNGIVTTALGSGQPNAASFEMWVNVQENRFWARLFDFGSSNLGEDTSAAGSEQDYLMLVSQGFNNTYGFESHPAFADGTTIIGGLVTPVPPTPLPTGVEHHIVVTYDQNDTTAGPGGTAKIYLNNAAPIVGPIGPDMPLGSLANENNDWLGRAQWNDPLIDALYNEFRIYDHALSPAEVTASNTAGPAAAPLPTLVINRDTGQVAIENQSGTSVQLTSYSITSATGGLNVSPGWDPIAPANGWTIQTQTDTELAEMGGTAATISGGGSIAISDAWIPSRFEDLEFSFSLTGGVSGLGEVQFVGNGGVPYARSDLDTDGDIDVNDWIAFLAGNGDNLSGLSTVAAYLQGDLNGDNANNHADFVLFRNDFIAANGAGAFAELGSSVPEPSAVALTVLTFSVLGAVRLRRSH